MTSFKTRLRLWVARATVIAAGLVSTLAACEDDADGGGVDAAAPGEGDKDRDAGDQNRDAGKDQRDQDGQGGQGGKEPVYLTAITVWTQDRSFQYAKLSHELDLNFTAEDLRKAREFEGGASFAVQDGYLLVGSEESPLVTKFEITDDLEWKQVGEPLNFGDYPDVATNYYHIDKGNDQLFFYGSDQIARVRYQVDKWAIAGDYEDSKLPEREGWKLANAGNRTRVSNFKDAVVWPFVFSPPEEKEYEERAESYLAVYDGKSFEETSVLKPSCPALQQATLDEDGNFYFSTTWHDPLFSRYGQQRPNCVVKIKADGTLDETFGDNGELDIESLTGGLSGVNFRYIADGKGVVTLLEHERLEGAKFDDDVINRDVWCQSNWCEDLEDMYRGDLWVNHVVDLETKTSKPITGYDPDSTGQGNYRLYYHVDGRTFFWVEGGKEGEFGLTMYELDLDTATVSLVGRHVWAPESEAHLTVISRVR